MGHHRWAAPAGYKLVNNVRFNVNLLLESDLISTEASGGAA